MNLTIILRQAMLARQLLQCYTGIAALLVPAALHLNGQLVPLVDALAAWRRR